MQQIKTLFENYEVKKTDITANSEWAEWVGKFTDRLNEDRGKYKPLTPRRVAMLLAPHKGDIHYLWSLCDNSKCFGKKFWYYAKAQKKNN